MAINVKESKPLLFRLLKKHEQFENASVHFYISDLSVKHERFEKYTVKVPGKHTGYTLDCSSKQ